MSSTFNRLAFGRIAVPRLVLTYAVGIAVGVAIAFTVLSLLGPRLPAIG